MTDIKKITDNGFTLIEIMVSITVIFLLISITFAGYARLNLRQNLISSGQTMKNILRDTQSRAYNGEIDCAVCDCTPISSSSLTGWYADFSAKEIYGMCGTNVFMIKPFNLADDIVINVTPPSGVLFSHFPPSASQKTTICLSNNNLSGSFYNITIEKSGEISDSAQLVPLCSS